MTLQGIFDTITATAYPATHSSFALYFKLTDLKGEYRFKVVILAPDLKTEVGTIEFHPITMTTPLEPLDIGVNASSLGLPVPGRYAVRLMYNGRVADEFSVEAKQI